MRILFAYRGTKQLRLEELPRIATSHMSAVNDVQLCHVWRSHGHEIDIWIKGAPLNPDSYDLLYLFKLHSMKFVQAGHLSLPWKRIAAWYDCGKVADALKADASRLESIAWGTGGLMLQEVEAFPHTRHLVVEHAPTFPTPPKFPETKPCGLYIGRIPTTYRIQLEAAMQLCAFNILALKIELGGRMVLLRPGQFEAGDLELVRAWCPEGSKLQTAVNLIAHPELAVGCFGLVPSTRLHGPQVLSACKVWDYWALGLPVVISNYVPEAHWVQLHPFLGYITSDAASLKSAIEAAIARSRQSNFDKDRQQIQSWTFSRHTWQHRAEEIENAQFTQRAT